MADMMATEMKKHKHIFFTCQLPVGLNHYIILTANMISPPFTPARSAGEASSTEITCTSQA